MNRYLKIVSLIFIFAMIVCVFAACKSEETLRADEETIGSASVDSTRASSTSKSNSGTYSNTQGITKASSTTVTTTANHSTTKSTTAENNTTAGVTSTTYPDDEDITKGVDNTDNIIPSASEISSIKAVVREKDGSSYVVEKLDKDKPSGAKYRFVYNSGEFNVDDKVVVEFTYPVEETFPYGIKNIVRVYKAG